MSVATYIASIEASRNTIRNKLIEMGMAQSTDKLEALAAAIDELIDRGAVSVTVKEGDTYTIPKGYHNGSGTVSGVGGGGSYNLQAKTVTPTKKQQNITPDAGYFGLSDVTVSAIPVAYQDVSSVDAGAGDVLTGKVFVTADGTITPGEMINNGAVNKTLDATTITYTIPKGYHSGAGTVKLVLETKTITPTKSAQEVTPTAGKVLSKVTVEAIPAKYQDVSGVTATRTDVASGKTFVDANGNVVEGNLEEEGILQITNNVSVETDDGTIEMVAPITRDVIVRNGGYSRLIASNSLFGNARPDQVVQGVSFTSASGVKVDGKMADNGAVNATIDGLTTTTYTVPAGRHNGSGKVSLTNDIENALAAI